MNIEPGFSTEQLGSANAADDEELRLARKRRIILISAIVILAIAGLWWFTRSGEEPAATQEPAPSVTLSVPGTRTIARVISVTGNLAARREMPVGVAGEGGMISRVLVEPGDWVGAGQTLATIDASVQVQQANQLRAQVTAARADAVLAEAELRRALSLVDNGFISKADVERKTATRDAARARVSVAQAQLGEVQARIGRLGIRAPAAGLVLTRAVEPGQVVGPSNGTLFRLAKGGEMELRAKLSETDLSRIVVGNHVKVTPVGSKLSFDGEVWQLSPVIDATSRQGIARVALKYDPALRPGGFASAELNTGSSTVPLLPESAVLSDKQGNYVYILGASNKVARRNVTVGQVSDAGLAITAGLNGSEKVVVSAGAFLNPGDPVQPVIQGAQK